MSAAGLAASVRWLGTDSHSSWTGPPTDAEFALIERTLNGFEQADSDDRTFAVALTAQQDLAQATGISHRVKPVDLMIAALGHQHGLGVLHYDKDYEVLSSRSSLVFTSRWIAPKGSVD